MNALPASAGSASIEAAGTLSAPSLADPALPPQVSFIVAACNVAPFIAAAIRSALDQQRCRVEVVVADDASDDGTADIVADMAALDPRVRLIRRARRGGVSAARNAALAVARGEWLAVLDGDDLLAPGRSRHLLDLAAATSADVVADNILRFTGTAASGVPALRQGKAPYALQLDVASYMLANGPLNRGTNLGYLKPMVRRAFMEGHALRYDERLTIGEDYRLCLEALLAGARFVVGSAPFYYYRVRPGSLSWRLTVADLDRMIAAHAALAPRLRSGSPAVVAAAAAYHGALLRAMSIQMVVDACKGRRWPLALSVALRRPGSWRFLAAVGGNRAGRFVSSRVAGRRTAS